MQTLTDFAEQFTAYQAERTAHFTGRKWLFEVIDRWLARPDTPRFFILSGSPGSGKTAIAGRLHQLSQGQLAQDAGSPCLCPGFLSAVHFCWFQERSWLSSHAFVESLALQLSQRYPAFATALAENASDRSIRIDIEQHIEQVHEGQVTGIVIHRLDAGGLPVEDAFRQIVRKPLTALLQQHPDTRLVVLVDGLDEALHYSGDVDILSLLAHSVTLPEQLRFIITTRPEPKILDPLREAGAEECLLTAGSGLVQSRDDVQQYVVRTLDERCELSDKLAADLSRDAFAKAVAQHSEGNFLYVHYLLEMLTTSAGPITPVVLETLPDGLEGIYHAFLDRLIGRHPDRWERDYEPILGTLAVAQPPLNEAQLAGIIGIRPMQARWRLHATRQFVTTDDKLPPSQKTYEIYHRSFADFLLDEDRADVYWCEEQEQHQRIVNAYVNVWGGWESRFPKLQELEEHRQDNGYGLRFFVVHLEAAGQVAHLHRLLGLENNDGQNIWYEAKDAAGGLAGYMADVSRAWRRAEQRESFENHTQLGCTISLQIRYALITTSIKSRAKNLPSALLVALVRYGVWKTDRALAELVQIPDTEQKGETIAALAQEIPREFIQELLSVTLGIPPEQERIRAKALVALAPRLSDKQLEQVLEIIRSQFDSWRGWVLARFVPYLPEKLLPTARSAAEELPNRGIWSPLGEVLAVLTLRHAQLGSLQSALEEAQSIPHIHWRIMAVSSVISFIPEAQRVQLLRSTLQEASRVPDEIFQAEEMTALAKHLPQSKRPGVLRLARKAARRISNNKTKVKILVELAFVSGLPQAERIEVLCEAEEALDPSSYWSQEDRREAVHTLAIGYAKLGLEIEALQVLIRQFSGTIEALLALLPHLSISGRERVLEEVFAVAAQFDELPSETVALLAPYLQEDSPRQILQKALYKARTIEDFDDRARSLAALAPPMVQMGNLEVAQQVAAMVRAMKSPYSRATTQQELALQFARRGCLQEAIAIVKEINNTYSSTLEYTLVKLAPYLTEQWMPEAAAEARKVQDVFGGGSDALEALACRWIQLGDIERAIALVGEIYSEYQEWTVAQMLEQMTQTLPLAVLEELLEAVQKNWPECWRIFAALAPRFAKAGDPSHACKIAESIGDGYLRLKALASVVPYLPEDKSYALLDQVVAAADDFDGAKRKIEAWIVVARYQSETLKRTEILQTAKKVALAADDEQLSASLLMDLATLLPVDDRPAVYQRALDIVKARGVNYLNYLYPDDLERLAFCLSDAQLEEFRTAVRKDEGDDYYQDKIWAEVLPHLAELGNPEQALKEAMSLRRHEWRGTALSGLARYLSPALLTEALNAVPAIYYEGSQVTALVGLAPHLQEEQLRHALNIVGDMKTKECRAEALEGLTPHLRKLPIEVLDSLWTETLHRSVDRTRQDLLSDIRALIPVIIELGGEEAIRDTYKAIQDVERWWL